MRLKRKPGEKLKSCQGMTMLEIVFAMSVLLACAFVFSAAFPTSTANRQKSDTHAVALTLADREMEALRDAGYGVVNTYAGLYSANLISASPTASPYSITSISHGSAQTIGNALPSGTGTLTITSPSTGILRLTVVVNWSDRGSARSLSLSSDLANLE